MVICGLWCRGDVRYCAKKCGAFMMSPGSETPRIVVVTKSIHFAAMEMKPRQEREAAEVSELPSKEG